MTTTSLADAWAELTATALLGTDRRPLPPPPSGPAGEFGHGSDIAVALLDRAAAVQAARRAGTVPEAAGPPLPVCPPDDRPPCAAPAARRLGRILRGEHPDLLDEWLRSLTAAGRAAPPEHLVDLMDRTRAAPGLRPVVVEAAGPVAGWLSGLVPGLGWGIAVPMDPLEAWERGEPAERVEALRRLRSVDPAAARELLASGLPGERAELRAAAYRILAAGLGPQDESLLELALDDRVAAVRQQAAELLAALPSSAWAQRMARRAARMVQIGGPAGHDRFEIALVAPVPPSWARDGIDAAAPPGTSLGVHVLRQVVAGTPLGWWEEQAPIPHLVVLAAEHELGPVLMAAWSAAAVRQRDPRWARVLVGEVEAADLVALLEPADVVQLAVDTGTVEQVLTPVALAAFETLPAPWPTKVRVGVTDAVGALFAQRQVGRHQVPSLRRLARALDPSLLREVAESIGVLALPPPLDGVCDDLADLLCFRADLHEELAEGGAR
jgi:Family of unknown function (DUF5691)